MDRATFVADADADADAVARAAGRPAPGLAASPTSTYCADVGEALDVLEAEGHDPLGVGAPFAVLYCATYARHRAGDIDGARRLEADRRRWLRAVAAEARRLEGGAA